MRDVEGVWGVDLVVGGGFGWVRDGWGGLFMDGFKEGGGGAVR